jgi:biopolymer transport protein ExbD
MSGTLSSENRAEPNLTPLLDMVFQLITFFMLVINFKTAALDLNLRLPVVGSARPVESLPGDLLVLNIDKEGTLKVYNNPIKDKDIPAYIANEAQASLLAARRNNPKIQSGDDLPTTVVVRADKETPFHLLNRVISSCQVNGYRNFSLKALNRKQEP